MSEEVYLRQSRVRDLVLPASIAVVGCGGIGSWVGFISAMSGVKRFSLFDSDTLERHNLNRLPYKETDVGKNKAKLLAELILSYRPSVEVLCYPNLDNAIIINKELPDVIYLCMDTPRQRLLLDRQLRDSGHRVVNLMCEENLVTILPTVEDVWFDTRAPGYDDPLAQWVVPQCLIASLGIAAVSLGIETRMSGFIQTIFEKMKDG